MKQNRKLTEDLFLRIYGEVAYNGKSLMRMLYEYGIYPSVFYCKYARMLHTGKAEPIGICPEAEETVRLIDEARRTGVSLEEVCARNGCDYDRTVKIGNRYHILAYKRKVGTPEDFADEDTDDGDLGFDIGKFTKCCTCKLEEYCKHKEERTGKCEAYVADLAKRWREIDLRIYNRNRERFLR